MNTPCNTCKHITEKKNGFRIFIGCDDDERKLRFEYDNFFYDHTCKGREPREECLDCKNYGKLFGYCNSSYQHENGKCINKSK